MKLNIASKETSPPFKRDELERAAKDLKTKKSRDNEGLINELFKENVMGENMKKSLLIMMNLIKKDRTIPQMMRYANITPIHKKSSRLELKNFRGVFRVSCLRG